MLWQGAYDGEGCWLAGGVVSSTPVRRGIEDLRPKIIYHMDL